VILLRFIGSFLAIVAFFSFGAVAGVRSKSKTQLRAPSPSLLDLAIILLSWVAAFSSHRAGYRTALATMIGAGAAFFAGFILHLLLRQSAGQQAKVGTAGGRIPVPGIESTAPQSDEHAQPRWRTYLRQVGGFQSRIFLSGFYYVAILPFGLVAGIFGDPLGLKVPPGDSFWKPRESDSQKLEDARGQS
jgi:hypothetical protein